LFLAFLSLGRHLPVSFYISALAALSYFISLPLYRLRSPHRDAPFPRPNRERISAAEHLMR
jgi:hypothetical protein